MKIRTINCRNVRNLLPLHAGGDLEERQAVAVDEHLHACLPCFREYRELIAMRGRLGVLIEQPLPEGALDGFTQEVMARIAVGEPGPRAELPRSFAWRRGIPRLAAAAALLLMVGVGAHQVGLLGAVGAVGGDDLRSASDRVVSSSPVADGELAFPRGTPLADVPSPLSGGLRQPGRVYLNVPSNRLDSALFDYLPAGQTVPVSSQAGLETVGRVWGRGLVVDPGRELRPRFPSDER